MSRYFTDDRLRFIGNHEDPKTAQMGLWKGGRYRVLTGPSFFGGVSASIVVAGKVFKVRYSSLDAFIRNWQLI